MRGGRRLVATPRLRAAAEAASHGFPPRPRHRGPAADPAQAELPAARRLQAPSRSLSSQCRLGHGARRPFPLATDPAGGHERGPAPPRGPVFSASGGGLPHRARGDAGGASSGRRRQRAEPVARGLGAPERARQNEPRRRSHGATAPNRSRGASARGGRGARENAHRNEPGGRFPGRLPGRCLPVPRSSPDFSRPQDRGCEEQVDFQSRCPPGARRHTRCLPRATGRQLGEKTRLIAPSGPGRGASSRGRLEAERCPAPTARFRPAEPRAKTPSARLARAASRRLRAE